MVRHGLRVSEACQLKLSDIDLQGKTMHVKRKKNGVSTTHPLYNGEAKAIKDWMLKRQEMSLDALTPGTPCLSRSAGDRSSAATFARWSTPLQRRRDSRS